MKITEVTKLHPAHHLRGDGQTHKATKWDWLNAKELNYNEIVDVLDTNERLLTKNEEL